MKLFKALFLFAIVSSISSAQEVRFGVGIPIIDTKKIYSDIEVQTRKTFVEDASLNKNMATLSLGYNINSHLKIGGSYRLVYRKFSNESSGNRNLFGDEGVRTTLDFSYKTKSFNQIRLKNKLRYQVSYFENSTKKSYLRNKTLVYYKVSKSFKPYAGLELIQRLEKKKLKGFRIHMGGKIRMYKHELTIFFILENEFKDIPINLNYTTGIKLLI